MAGLGGGGGLFGIGHIPGGLDKGGKGVIGDFGGIEPETRDMDHQLVVGILKRGVGRAHREGAGGNPDHAVFERAGGRLVDATAQCQQAGEQQEPRGSVMKLVHGGHPEDCQAKGRKEPVF